MVEVETGAKYQSPVHLVDGYGIKSGQEEQGKTVELDQMR